MEKVLDEAEEESFENEPINRASTPTEQKK